MSNKRWETGCYGDGSLGHQHTREACAHILRDVAYARGTVGRGDLNEALLGEMSDDAWEEEAGQDWLNAYVPIDGASWGWRDGNFGLWPNEEE